MSYRVFIVLVLCVSIVAACRNEDRAEAMDPEMRAALQLLEDSIQENVLTEGEFETLSVGEKKRHVIVSLRDMGIDHVFPEEKDVLTVTKASDLYKITESSSLVLGAGSVWVSFEGDRVSAVRTAPQSEWERRTKKLSTRDEVFAFLADVLDSDKKAFVRNHSADSRWVKLDNSDDEGMQLLDRLDAWEMSRSNNDGYWHFRLEFDNDSLQKIIVKHSPQELP